MTYTPTKTRMTQAEYRNMPETVQKMELIDGELIVPPAPIDAHQSTSLYGTAYLIQVVPEGEWRTSPSDVYIDDVNILQPDIFWVSPENTQCVIKDKYWHGAPDLVIEILSPATAKVDRGRKFEIYEQNGVREYWLVDPTAKFVEVYTRSEAGFKRFGVFGADETFESPVLYGRKIELAKIFR